MSFEEYLKDEQDEKEEMDLRVRSKVEMILGDKKKSNVTATEIYHSQPCKYRLPCGRCDKTNEMCADFHFVPLGVAPVIVPNPSEWDRMNKEEAETTNVKYSDATDYTTDTNYTDHS